MNIKTGPKFWLIFGLFGFPIVCFVNEISGWIALVRLGLSPKNGIPEFGWGGFPGLFLGVPLGIISASSAYGWRNERFIPARCVAFLGGISIGSWWLNWLLPMSLVGWVGDFGFIVPPLIWSLSLCLFALFARSPRD